MTTTVHAVDMECSLETATEVMVAQDIRHLPVLDGDNFVGVVSGREVEMLRALPLLDMAALSVSDAMTMQTYVVGPDEPLQNVVREMADKKFGSVVVAEGTQLLGIFTTIDALRVCDELLS